MDELNLDGMGAFVWLMRLGLDAACLPGHFNVIQIRLLEQMRKVSYYGLLSLEH